MAPEIAGGLKPSLDKRKNLHRLRKTDLITIN